MQASEALITAIKQFESFYPNAYQDEGGVWTIGWGNANNIQRGMTVTQEQAEMDLRNELAQKAREINLFLPGAIVRQPQFDALLDFAFNLGVTALHNSTLLKLINSGNLTAAANQFPLWCHDQGRVLPGLYIRRCCERDWFENISPVCYPSPGRYQALLAEAHALINRNLQA